MGLQDPIDNKIILLRLTFGRHQTFHHEGQSPVCRKQGKSSQTDFEIFRRTEDWAGQGSNNIVERNDIVQAGIQQGVLAHDILPQSSPIQ